jgi:hypothetical protein
LSGASAAPEFWLRARITSQLLRPWQRANRAAYQVIYPSPGPEGLRLLAHARHYLL